MVPLNDRQRKERIFIKVALKRGILSAFLITYEYVFSGINFKKILWNFAFKDFVKHS